MEAQTFDAWYTTYPRTHRFAGQTVEVVPRRLLEEMTMRHAGASGSEELEGIREKAASVVERCCSRLEITDSEISVELASELRVTMLQLIEMATRGTA